LHGALWGENGYDSNSKSSAMDLFECIEQNESFEEDKARLIFKQILSALLHLHDIGLVHRDIKDENILIDQNFHVKLIDFGSAAFFDPTGKKNFNVFLGTKQYASPEILMRQEYRGPEADVWALGCCLYIILTATIPFACLEDAMLRPFIKPNRYLHPLCLDLLQRMLEKNPSKRATLKDIHRHPWVQWNDN
jgi:PAS domain-containing serine/threonine kinase